MSKSSMIKIEKLEKLFKDSKCVDDMCKVCQLKELNCKGWAIKGKYHPLTLIPKQIENLKTCQDLPENGSLKDE